MKPRRGLPGWIRNLSAGLLLLSGCGLIHAQDSASAPPPPNDPTGAAIRELQQQVRERREAVAEMQAETAKYRAENRALRGQLQAARHETASASAPTEMSYPAPSAAEALRGADPPQTSPQAQPLESQVAALQETVQLLNSKLDDQYQTKVESASKYRVRLSGIALFNLFSNRGMTDTQDVPSFVTGPNQGNGNFGATLRQSEIGLEVFGPTIAGARTSGSLQADFGGGFSSTWNGVDSGIFRLRTASLRMDWQDTSLVVGQDDLFISPLSPASYASLLVPAFNYAGNLWAWTPQIRVEHRFRLSDEQSIAIQGGILDNLTGEFPGDPYFRTPGPGENSGQPAYALRTSWTRSWHDHPLTLAAAGYYSRQDWEYGHHVDGWAGLLDWQVPLSRQLTLAGEFYRGRALGGLNAAFGRSVVYDGNPGGATTAIRGLDSVGGWSQLKFRATAKLEFNAGYGSDNPDASEARLAASSQPYVGPLFVQNRSALGNVIYRPRSNLLLSGEYRRLRTFQLDSGSHSGQQVNLMMGILF